MHVIVFILVVWFFDPDKAQVIHIDSAQQSMEMCQLAKAQAFAKWAGQGAVRHVDARCIEFVEGNTV